MKQRFVTLDVFRGMTVFLMIVVNTQGSGAEPFAAMTHAEWNGCTLTDLVFPSFLFAVGNAMAFTQPELGKILRRSLLLFVIGWLLTWWPFTQPLNETRVMAVLQRIGLAYGLGALVVRWMEGGKPVGWTREWKVTIVSVGILLVYWLLLYVLGTPGEWLTVEGNAVRRIDLLVLGPRHMYREKGVAFDPEGLLSTLPAMVNVLAGWLAGRWIIRKGKKFATAMLMLLIGLLLLAIALVWNEWLPLNKKLWTSSYVVYTSAIDLLVLGVLFYFIEVREWKWGVRFFSVFGKNPLFIYILSTMMGIFLVIRMGDGRIFIDEANALFFQRVAPGAMGALLFSFSYTLICWLVGWVLDKRKIYIRL